MRWIAPDGKRRQKQFSSKRRADLWAAEITRKREDGLLERLTPSQITLTELAMQWLDGPAQQLAESTRKTYVGVIELHLLRWLGDTPIASISRGVVQDWQDGLTSAGVTPEPRRRALKYLRMLLNYAISREYLTLNTASLVRMPKVAAADPPRPLSPSSVESLRRSMESPDGPYAVSLMAYAGLRPQECFAIQWGNVRDRTILIRSTKTNRVDSVAMLDPLASDLREWKMMSGQPGDQTLVIPRARGGEWTRTAQDNWRKRVFDPACQKAGIVATPYTLRHSFASLLIHAHYPVTYVAQQMRHGLDMTMRHYAHVIADLDPAIRIDPSEAIFQARGELKGDRHAK